MPTHLSEPLVRRPLTDTRRRHRQRAYPRVGGWLHRTRSKILRPMSDLRDQVGGQVRAACQPSRIEIIRAKNAMLRVLADDKPHETGRLVWALLEEEGLAAGQDPDVTFDAAAGIEAALAAMPPSILRARLTAAGHIALSELEGDGIVLRSTSSVREAAGALGLHVRVTRVQGSGSTSTGIEVGVEIDLGRVYQRSRAASEVGVEVFDADLFVADLSDLGLDSTTLSVLRESINCYRRQLFRASAVLLGVVVEGAWYTAAERAKHLSAELDRVLQDDLATAKVQKRLVDLLRKTKDLGKTVPDELHSHASLMRAIRNYGVHPRPGQDEKELERFFTEEGCGLLLLNSRQHLKMLLDSVTELLRQQSP